MSGDPWPKISVVIPTRDKLEFLRFAVESVLLQDYGHWELVVSDNCSSDDIRGYLDDLDDARISYQRSDAPLAVTESWNFALSGATGDLLMLLGNDDGLAPGALSRVADTWSQFGPVDLICGRYLRFAYPGVMPSFPNGQLWRCGVPDVFGGVRRRKELTVGETRHLAERTANFHGLDKNLQCLVFSRVVMKAITIDGAFFRGPWPDFYVLLPLLLLSSRVIVDPEPLALVGMSPRSMHAYIYEGRIDEGNRTYLLNAEVQQGYDTEALPSKRMALAFFQANALAIETFGVDAGISLNRRKYRRDQVAHAALQWRAGSLPRAALRPLVASLSWKERVWYALLGLFWFTATRIIGARRRATFFRRVEARLSYSWLRGAEPLAGEFGTLRDVFRAV